jgi:molybdopterin synthase catalytic subunit
MYESGGISSKAFFKQRKGIAEVRAWINAENLNVGDNIMLLLVAGRFKTDVLPVLEELLTLVKNEIVTEEEFQ